MKTGLSYVVTDPNGYILKEFGSLLENYGYKLKILNLMDFSKSLKYNPLAYVHSERDIEKLVDILLQDTQTNSIFGEKTDTLLINGTKTLLQALIGAIVDKKFSDNEKNLNSVVELLKLFITKDEGVNLESVDLYFKELEAINPNHFAVSKYKAFRSLNKRLGNIIVNCATCLAPFNMPQVQDLVRKDELELDKLGDEKTVLFILYPHGDWTFHFFVSILYMQLFSISD